MELYAPFVMPILAALALVLLCAGYIGIVFVAWLAQTVFRYGVRKYLTPRLIEPLETASVNGDRCGVERLLSEAAKFHTFGVTYRETALFAASANGQQEIVELLIREGANIHGRDANGKTALYLAREAGHTGVVSLLDRAARRR